MVQLYCVIRSDKKQHLLYVNKGNRITKNVLISLDKLHMRFYLKTDTDTNHFAIATDRDIGFALV